MRTIPTQVWTVCVWCDYGSQDPRAEAEKWQTRLRQRGFPAAILWSTDFPPLTPGYWVTYSGVFDSQALAAAHLSDLKGAGFDGLIRPLDRRP